MEWVLSIEYCSLLENENVLSTVVTEKPRALVTRVSLLLAGVEDSKILFLASYKQGCY